MHNLSLYSRVCRAGEKTLNNHRKYYSTLLLRAPYGSCMVMVTPAELGSCKWLKTEQRTGEPLGGRKTNDERKREGGGRSGSESGLDGALRHSLNKAPPTPSCPQSNLCLSHFSKRNGPRCVVLPSDRRPADSREHVTQRAPLPPPRPPDRWSESLIFDKSAGHQLFCNSTQHTTAEAADLLFTVRFVHVTDRVRTMGLSGEGER